MKKLEKWIGQVDSYAFELGAPISILTNSSKILVRTYFSESKRQTSLNADIKQLEKTNYKELLMLLHHMSLIFLTKNEGINDNEANTVRLQRACSRIFNALDRKQRTDLLDRIMYDDNNVMLLNQKGNVAISVIFAHSKREVSVISDNNKEVIISASLSDLSLANVKDAVINEGFNIGVDPFLTETFLRHCICKIKFANYCW